MKPRGQIATFLLLLVSVVLIFALVVMNLGRVAATSTQVANATDSTMLLVASQLASRANQLCYAIDSEKGNNPKCITEKCFNTGLLSVILAIVAATIVTIATGGTAGPVAWSMVAQMAAAIGLAGAAGAVAGAIGGAIAGTGALNGAITGFGIGAGIAAGYLAGGKLVGMATTYSVHTGAAVATAMTAGGIAVGSTFVGLSAAATLYNTYAQNQMFGEAMAAAAKGLSGMPDYEQIREGALLQALIQTVDDPNFTDRGCHWVSGGTTRKFTIGGDPFDSDADGDTTESIPCFQYWWDRRTNLLAAGLGASAETVVTNFLNSQTGILTQSRNDFRSFLYALERAEVECPCHTGSPKGGPEGTILAVLRAMKPVDGGFLNFWEPGPGAGELIGWYGSTANNPCVACPPTRQPNGFDSVDSIRMRYEQTMRQLKGLIWSPGVQGAAGVTEKTWLQGLAGSYGDWLPLLYDPSVDPATDGTLHTMFGIIVNGDSSVTGLNSWAMKIGQARDQLPQCTIAYAQFATNAYEQPPGPAGSLPLATCLNSDPIDNCTWRDANPSKAVSTGIHLRDSAFTDPTSGAGFPGPVCRVRKPVLLPQLTHTSNFVSALPTYIRTNYATHFDNATCPAPPAAPALPGSTICQQLGKKAGGETCAVNSECCSSNCQTSTSCGESGRSCQIWAPGSSWCCPGGSCVDADALPDGDGWGKCSSGSTLPPNTCAAGGPPSPDSATAVVVTPQPQMTVNSIDQLGLVKIGGTGDKLDYTYTYQYQCQNCFMYGTVKICDPPYVQTKQQKKFYPPSGSGFGAPDVHLPSSSAFGFTTQLNGMIAAVNAMSVNFATIDADLVDEVNEIFTTLTTAVTSAQGFQTRLRDFYSALMGLSSPIRKAVDGSLPNSTQPVSGADDQWMFGTNFNGRYAWEDTHGRHSVEVEMSPFLVPSTSQRKYGNWLIGKTCMVLENYCDGYDPGDSNKREKCQYPTCCYEPGRVRGRDTWVRITRTDPVGPEVGMFWRLNPFGVLTRKTARAKYHTVEVGLDNTQN